jgi:hypothetical protein
MKLLKEIVKKGEKKYTNYILVIGGARIPIEVKTFGKAWNDPSIRKAYTLLSLASELVVKD